MEQLTKLICDTEAFKSLKKQFEQNAFSHAYLVSGQDPLLLKKFLVFATALALCPKGGCFKCITCNKVFSENHVDVKKYPSEKGKYFVTDINEIVDDCYVKPFEGERKVYILNDFDTMSVVLQNKLLKTLEEPPENTVFFLGAFNTSAVLPTVKSRCQKIHLDYVDFEKVISYLVGEGINEANAEIAASFCDGMPLTAESYARDKTFFLLFDKVVECVKNLDSSRDSLRTVSQLLSLSNDFKIVLKVMETLFVQTLKAYSDEDLLLLKHKKNDILTIKQKFSQRAVYNILPLLDKAKISLENNCNQTAVADKLVLGILEVRYSCPK